MLLTPLNASVLALGAILPQDNAQVTPALRSGRTPILAAPNGQNSTQAVVAPPCALAAGGNFIRVQTNSPGPAMGEKLKGIVNLGGSLDAFAAYNQLGAPGGLYRVHLQMWDSESVGRAGAQISMAQQAGYRVLLTASGTPFHLASSSDGQIYEGAIPPFARSVPTSVESWASELCAKLQTIQSQFGALPDLVEVGNEPDRPESWDGSLEDYLNLYSSASRQLIAHFPGIRIGGMGLAGSESQMGQENSALINMIEHCDANNLPLDFLSWHNYGMSTEIRYSRIIQRLRNNLSESGRANTELFITEWNIRPNTLLSGLEFDDSHGAANLTSFLAASHDLGLDGSCFFMLLDLEKDGAIQDLTGNALGALSSHGIKKPAYRAMEFVFQCAQEASLPVVLPDNEFALGAIASQSAGRTTLVLANDPVSPRWVFSKSCREYGLRPGVMLDLLKGIGASPLNPPSLNSLLTAGLTKEDARSLMVILDRSLEAQRLENEARVIEIQLEGMAAPSISAVWRFDSAHNSPLSRRVDLVPSLEIAEAQAKASALVTADQFLATLGNELPPELPEWGSSEEELSFELGITIEEAHQLRKAIGNTLRGQRLQNISFFDTLPGSKLEMETANEAGIRIVGATLRLELQPNSVVVLKVEQ
ncbi:MAG TPA: hypothetical protein QGG59_03685 [Planctomycetota bacterium]|nr:hypothetical protein [Planctomycetota bacterium]MDP7245436.1 hypothetical protein [Planctomycetota bacterium]HJM39200.1 hypothetical protein [Planctomycetota bacterium]|tara:strand:- start:87861 stop:89804 length:1944 start_codon:yes stop_codon:yes gene_type:complete